MKHRLWRLINGVILGLSLTGSAVPLVAGPGSPGTDVQQLANRVRKVIKIVEDTPTLPCETRNHLIIRLRSLDDALEAGNRSSARALVLAWRHEARSYQAAGLMSAGHGAIMHNGLHGLVEEIGTGWPKKPGPTRKWAPLPVCDTTATSTFSSPPPAAAPRPLAAAASTSCPTLPAEGSWDSEDTLVVLKTFLSEVPEVGGLLAGLLEILWPSSFESDVSAIIDRHLQCYIQTDAKDALRGMSSELRTWNTDLDNWRAVCANGNPAVEPCKTPTSQLYSSWDQMNSNLVGYRIKFQTSDAANQLMLLPLFAQYETAYISFLRDGAILAPAWIAAGTLAANAATPANTMADDLNPNFVDPYSVLYDPETGAKAPDRGIGYVNWVYNRGLDAQPEPTNWDNWIKWNSYVRAKTLQVLDFRDTWKFFDPAAYPEGVKGGIKLARMIYTDPVGHIDDFANDFKPPPNVIGPLGELTIWSRRSPFNDPDDRILQYGSYYAVSSTQATNPPTAGPALTGAITGDLTHNGQTVPYYLDLRFSGPITQVKTYWDQRSDVFNTHKVPSKLGFKPATSDWVYTVGGGIATPTEKVSDTQYNHIPWAYSGNVLATAKVMGTYHMDSGSVADSVIFGFRRYDSFFPSGALVSVVSGWCLNGGTTPTAGTEPTVTPCTGAQGQIWTYEASTKAVTIFGFEVSGDVIPLYRARNLCLEEAGLTSGSAVFMKVCNGAKNQQWDVVPTANGLSGMIKSAESGLVATATLVGSTIVLRLSAKSGTYGSAYQQWTSTSPLTGEVHGIGSGRCLDVRADNTTNGTPVQIYDCSGGAAQAWTYNESSRTLSVHGGTKCLDAGAATAGLGLRIWDCSGAANQQWTFNSNRTLSLANGLVLDVQSGSMVNQALAVLSAAVAGKTSQMWSRPSKLGKHVHATYAGKCLDGSKLLNSTQAQIATCVAPPAPGQEWMYHPLTQRITAHGDGTEHCLAISGTAVVVTSCEDNPNQLWTLQNSGIGGTIVSTPSISTATPLCMTLAGTGTVTAEGAKVEMQACAAAAQPINPNQQWIWP